MTEAFIQIVVIFFNHIWPDNQIFVTWKWWSQFNWWNQASISVLGFKLSYELFSSLGSGGHNLTDEPKRWFRSLHLNFLKHFFRHFEVSGGHNLTDEAKRFSALGCKEQLKGE